MHVHIVQYELVGNSITCYVQAQEKALQETLDFSERTVCMLYRYYDGVLTFFQC